MEELITVNDRIRIVRNHHNLNQSDFAQRINMGIVTVSNVEKGHKEPSAKMLNLISQNFNISETWLRTGEGEMFKLVEKLDKNVDLMHMVADLIKDNSPHKDLKKKLILTLAKMPDNMWDTVYYILDKLSEEDDEDNKKD